MNTRRREQGKREDSGLCLIPCEVYKCVCYPSPCEWEPQKRATLWGPCAEVPGSRAPLLDGPVRACCEGRAAGRGPPFSFWLATRPSRLQAQTPGTVSDPGKPWVRASRLRLLTWPSSEQGFSPPRASSSISSLLAHTWFKIQVIQQDSASPQSPVPLPAPPPAPLPTAHCLQVPVAVSLSLNLQSSPEERKAQHRNENFEEINIRV